MSLPKLFLAVVLVSTAAASPSPIPSPTRAPQPMVGFRPAAQITTGHTRAAKTKQVRVECRTCAECEVCIAFGAMKNHGGIFAPTDIGFSSKDGPNGQHAGVASVRVDRPATIDSTASTIANDPREYGVVLLKGSPKSESRYCWIVYSPAKGQPPYIVGGNDDSNMNQGHYIASTAVSGYRIVIYTKYPVYQKHTVEPQIAPAVPSPAPTCP